MPKENKINCPACGFALKSGSKTCEFCGYEFEEEDLSSSQPDASRDTVGMLENRQSSKPAVSRNGNKKTNGAGKKTTRNPPVKGAANGKNGSMRKGGAQDGDFQAGTAVEPRLEPEDTTNESGTQARIKELEKQLTDAEKELDVISKLLNTGGHEKPAAAEASAPVTYAPPAAEPVRTAPPSPTPVQPAKQTIPVNVPAAKESAPAAVEDSSHTSGKLFFRFRGMTAGAIIVGLVVYALSYLISTNIGRMEMYLLLLPASILVALGIYSSLEGSPASQRL